MRIYIVISWPSYLYDMNPYIWKDGLYMRKGPGSSPYDTACSNREGSAGQQILICDWLIDHLAAADQTDQYRMALMM